MIAQEDIRNEAHNRYCNAETDPIDSARYCAFVNGANWMTEKLSTELKQQFIEKAYDWLKDNIYNRVYECGDKLGFPTAEFLNQFKAYMED